MSSPTPGKITKEFGRLTQRFSAVSILLKSAGQKRLLDVDNPLVLPEGSKVKVLIAGNDVMHSFFVPSLAVQEYSVPGRLNEVWMDIPMGEKTYYGQCNQICGINHAYMPVAIKVLSKKNYESWLKNAKIEFAKSDILNSNQIILAEVKN